MSESSPAAIRQKTPPADLSRYAVLSIVAAIATISLKLGAYYVSSSVGLLSDACESFVNLAAAIIAFIALKVAARPGDRSHNFGHTKAEYFSAAAEGMMIFIAAVVIIWTSAKRLLHPEPLTNIGLGLIISVIASILNGTVAWILFRAAARHRSMTLKADAHHLLTDVWTSAGVMLGVGLMFLAKLAKLDWWWLDPIIGLAVGVNIIWAGWKLMQESFAGLMDASMSKEDNEALAECLAAHVIPGQINFHGLRTRIAGRERFAQAHLLVPGYWSVQKAHDLCEIIENDVFTRFDELEIMFHLEPIEDELSYADVPITSIPVHEEGHLPPSATAYNQ